MGTEAVVREKQITKTSVIGIIANIFLSAFKAAVGLISGSIAIVLDAVNNLTDAVSSVITIIGIKVARRDPDKKHPFGHGRMEYFSAILIAAIILAAGAASLVESVKKIIKPNIAEYSTPMLVIICVAIVTKLLLGRYVTAQGKKYRSDALIASGSDATFDAIVSISTLVGAAVTLIWHISIDGFIGAVISLFIVKAGIGMLMHSANLMLGFRPDSKTTTGIKSDIAAFPQVLGVCDLVLHNYGPDYAIGSVNIEVPDTLTARQIHVLTHDIHNVIVKKYSVFLTVGIYAVNLHCDKQAEIRKQIYETVGSFEGVLQIHALYIDKHTKSISFDVVLDFSVSDRTSLRDAIHRAVCELYPNFTVEVSVDTDFSD